MKALDSPKVSSKDSAQDLAQDHRGADYVLDVKTANWMFAYYPSDWSHYRVMYVARFRLIEVG